MRYNIINIYIYIYILLMIITFLVNINGFGGGGPISTGGLIWTGCWIYKVITEPWSVSKLIPSSDGSNISGFFINGASHHSIFGGASFYLL